MSIQHCLGVSLLSLTLLGCEALSSITTTERVQPWQRGILAKEAMLLTGDPIDTYVDTHIYFSKEAATGGKGAGGGGCGCN